METGIIMLLVGLILGMIIGLWRLRAISIGELQVIKSDEPESYLFLELDHPISDFESKKYVIMRVTQKSYISHE